MNRGGVLSTLLSLLVLVTCGEDAPGDDRGEAPGSAPCAAGELTRPDGSCQPAGLPPDMACPPGERALADGRCQPAGVPAEACAAGRWVSDGRGGCAPILPEQVCPSGQMAVPGERACREVSPCGEGAWGNIPVEATTEHVDPAYAGIDSDGSQARPWKTAREGVRAASSGAIVALAEGRYTEDVLISNKPVRLWGRCPSRTVVDGSGLQKGAITIARERASGSEVRGLAVTGPYVGIVVQGARAVVIEEVWGHETGGAGVLLENGAGVTLRASLREQTRVGGVFIEGSEATVEATVVRATQPTANGAFGRGIVVQQNLVTGERGKLSLTASLIEQNHEVGLLLLSSEARVTATVVRATKQSPAGMAFGDGILAVDNGGQLGAAITATESNDNARVGVLYVSSTGDLSGVHSSGNRFGLVLDPGTSGALPTLGEGNAFEGNIEADELRGGDLPVPDVAPPVP